MKIRYTLLAIELTLVASHSMVKAHEVTLEVDPDVSADEAALSLAHTFDEYRDRIFTVKGLLAPIVFKIADQTGLTYNSVLAMQNKHTNMLGRLQSSPSNLYAETKLAYAGKLGEFLRLNAPTLLPELVPMMEFLSNVPSEESIMNCPSLYWEKGKRYDYVTEVEAHRVG